MNPERWRQIEDLYHAAIERQPDQRAAFLEGACAGDQSLLREVQSLLSEEAATPAAAARKERFAPGDRLGPYQIVESLGAGGMGEVYRARDIRLRRTVAIKALLRARAGDPERMRRFLQEARAASALNHPNIAVLYDFGSDNGADYLVLEYVPGQTLDKAMRGRALALRDAVRIGAQVSSALRAAHAAGVTHRDIKPQNIVVTPEQQAKVLDFGLAKLVEPAGEDAETLTIDPSITTPGLIFGTVSYMSPEQAEGRPMDPRTDIFSLGIVLYETLTGRRPFEGKSVTEILHAIIHDEPPAPSAVNAGIPPEMDEIAAKMLVKNPAERYQHAGDVELDLLRFQRGWEGKTLPSMRTTVTAGRRPSAATSAVVVVCAAVLAAAGWWAANLSKPARTAGSLADVTVRPLTADPGYEGEPTFAPDGSTIAYVSDRTGQLDIFLRQVTGGADINLTHGNGDNVQPAFSPDGKQIAFVSSRSGGSEIAFNAVHLPLIGGDVWVMPALGGAARRIARNGNFPSWSADGSSVIYVSGTWFRSGIYRVSASGGEARQIPLDFPADRNKLKQLLFPAYSSDGRWIVFEGDETIFVVPAAGGTCHEIPRGRYPIWSADSHSILHSSGEDGKNYSLSRIPFSLADGRVTGAPEPVTVGHAPVSQAATSRDGKLIAYTAKDESFNLEIAPFDAEAGRMLGPGRPITTGNQVIQFASFSPDGRSVAFQSLRGAGLHVWRLDIGAEPARLTAEPKFVDSYPKWSPDGRLIAFNRGPTELWLMAADGADPRRALEGVSVHQWLPDSSGLVVFSIRDLQIHAFDLASGHTRQITNEKYVMPIMAVSSDGRWLVYQSTAQGNIDLRAVPIAGGPSSTVLATPHQEYHPFFSPSGKWVYYQRDHKNLYRVPGPAQDWRADEPVKVTDFHESGLLLEDIQASLDGKQLLYSRGRITADIWIMTIGK